MGDEKEKGTDDKKDKEDRDQKKKDGRKKDKADKKSDLDKKGDDKKEKGTDDKKDKKDRDQKKKDGTKKDDEKNKNKDADKKNKKKKKKKQKTDKKDTTPIADIMQCPENSEFSEKCNSPDPTCDRHCRDGKIDTGDDFCASVCTERCTCNEGYIPNVRNDKLEGCIEASSCPEVQGSKN